MPQPEQPIAEIDAGPRAGSRVVDRQTRRFTRREIHDTLVVCEEPIGNDWHGGVAATLQDADRAKMPRDRRGAGAVFHEGRRNFV